MPYTLSMALLWVALAVLLGIVVGWLMRSVVAKRQVDRVRSSQVDVVELERLRRRVAELESASIARDRRPADDEASPGSPPEPAAEAETAPIDGAATDDGATDASDADAPGPTHGEDTPDGAGASGTTGRQVVSDDLTVVAGIDAEIADLCAGIGIRTWSDLAETEVSLLRTMLADAGPRFRSADPATWPEQAALLAAARWDEFEQLVARLGETSGRT
jgi:predicted flap endonuclease-1-like 5' DNA nuclease